MIKYSGLGFIATVDGSEILLTSGYGKYTWVFRGLYIYISQVVGLGISEPSTVSLHVILFLDVFQP